MAFYAWSLIAWRYASLLLLIEVVVISGRYYRPHHYHHLHYRRHRRLHHHYRLHHRHIAKTAMVITTGDRDINNKKGEVVNTRIGTTTVITFCILRACDTWKISKFY